MFTVQQYTPSAVNQKCRLQARRAQNCTVKQYITVSEQLAPSTAYVRKHRMFLSKWCSWHLQWLLCILVFVS